MTKLTPEALDALLAEHMKLDEHTDGGGCCAGCDSEPWPCEVYLLASEVRDARPVIEAAREWDEADRNYHTGERMSGFYVRAEYEWLPDVDGEYVRETVTWQRWVEEAEAGRILTLQAKRDAYRERAEQAEAEIARLAPVLEALLSALRNQGLLQNTASGVIWHVHDCPASFNFAECNYRCRVAREAFALAGTEPYVSQETRRDTEVYE